MTMLEKMAKAFLNGSGFYLTWDSMPADQQRLAVLGIKSALEALKHPDEGTVEAMALSLMQRKSFETPGQVSATIFTATIEHVQRGEG